MLRALRIGKKGSGLEIVDVAGSVCTGLRKASIEAWFGNCVYYCHYHKNVVTSEAFTIPKIIHTYKVHQRRGES